MRRLGPTLRAVVLALLALGLAIVAGAPPRLAANVCLLVVGAALLLHLARATRAAPSGAARSAFAAALAGSPSRSERPPELEQLERIVYLGVSNAFYLHVRLRPLLREIASSRLRANRAIDLEHDVGNARAAVGPATWELIRPNTAAPADRRGPGVPLSELRAAVDALEKI